jgi:hypothetical protein
MMKNEKPLGYKAYGSIPHLPGSNMGPKDQGITEGQARICTEKLRDSKDRVIVTEKLDGSCVAIAKINGEIVPLIRSGYRATDSKFLQHIFFHTWVMERQEIFDHLLDNEERVVGEWLAQAHGTRYEIDDDMAVFIAFDFFIGKTRMESLLSYEVLNSYGIYTPRVISDGPAISIKEVLSKLEPSGHGAIDPVEGAVWRVERNRNFDFMAKYVRPDKINGKYIKEFSGKPDVWNWGPLAKTYQDSFIESLG